MTRNFSHPKVVKIINGEILMLLFGHTDGKRVEIIIILLFFLHSRNSDRVLREKNNIQSNVEIKYRYV